MIAMGHPWLGAATLGGVLMVSALQSWMVVRSARDQHRALLSYAQTTTNMGGDPTTVITALRGSGGEEDEGPPALPPRGHTPMPQRSSDPTRTWSPPGPSRR
jgi:hypothetical protein